MTASSGSRTVRLELAFVRGLVATAVSPGGRTAPSIPSRR